MKFLKPTIYTLFIILALTLANQASATTEFTCVVDPDDDTGTDYTSLSAWEQYNQTDLTAATTLVFSHGGITGTIADDDTVTGATSGATATVVHATDTQILLESISGTFQSGEQVYETQDTNYVTTSDAGDDAISVASCRSSSGTADTTAVTISGWTTSATNYIKVYTTEENRHDGVWDEGKYRLEANSTPITNYEGYVRTEGIQIKHTGSGDNNDGITISEGTSESRIAYCIIQNTGAASRSGIQLSVGDVYAYDNIIYGWDDYGIRYAGSGTAYLYNNTIDDINLYNYSQGITRSSGTVVAINNIVQDCGNNDGDCFVGTFDASSDYNISQDATAPGDNSIDSTEVVFAGAGDYHLDSSESNAIDAGSDLSGESIFSDDIDSDTRPTGAWDIGADEYTIPIYRSVGPSASTALETGSGNDLTISGTTATFASALGDDVGVGDVIQYDDDNDGDIDADDSLAFIHGRTSSTVYTVKNSTGGTPTATAAADQDWSIFRSYDSLSHAESGDENDSIDDDLEAFESWSGGKDLTSSNEQWNIACYNGEGDAADTTNVTIDGWTTGENNYIKVYTPTETDEVGTSQRHDGVEGTGYTLQTTSMTIANYEENVKIVGIIFNGLNFDSDAGTIRAYRDYATGEVDIIIANCLFCNISNAGSYGAHGYSSYADATGKVKIYNNIFHSDDVSDDSIAIYPRYGVDGKSHYIYNNTIIDFGYHGIEGSASSSNTLAVLKNNITQGCVDGYYGPRFSASSDFNISDVSQADADDVNATFDGYKTVTFADETNDDFHLASTDTSAKDAGTDLSSDSDLSFSTDIDSHTRDIDGEGWDIGADESATPIYRSVGPSATSAIDSNSSPDTNTITISSGTATFAEATASQVGVGDVVLYDSNDSGTLTSDDSIAFIKSRTSSTVYTLQTETGAVPSDLSANDTWEIYRAYTSLSNAEAGTENSTLSALSISYTGGDRDLYTNNEQWNIACYANGTTADETAVTIDGWTTTASNYIKVYTPTETDEVGTSQRHDGVWDEGRYRLEYTANGSNQSVLSISEAYFRIIGLQISVDANSESGTRAINNGYVDEIGKHYYMSNIIKGVSTGLVNAIGLNDDDIDYYYVYNNIIYGGFNTGIIISSGISNEYVVNNTIIDCASYGIDGRVGEEYVKNNIIVDSGISDYYQVGSTYSATNLSSDATSPDGESYQNQNVSFVSTVSGAEDFHLHPDDTSAIDQGTDLSSDSNLAFSDDIDSHERTQWDIGADEASLEFDPTVKEADGDYSTLALWETGVQTDLTSDDTKVFSHSGITGTIADDDTVTGATSGATATVVHATSTQILLESISGTFESGEQVYETLDTNYVTTTNAGNPAIAVAKIDGAWTNADETAVTINGWTTGPNNYVKVYTTDDARHDGVWDEGKYILKKTATGSNSRNIYITEDYVIIEGLQLEVVSAGYGSVSGIWLQNTLEGSIITIRSNIIKGEFSGTGNSGRGIGSNGRASAYISNNIIYDFINNSEILHGINGGFSTTSYIFNNTIYNCYVGLRRWSSSIIAKNNITQSCTDGYDGTFDASSDFNISDVAADDAPNATFTDDYVTVDFVDEDNDDFHLASTDTSAKDAGTDLSSDSYLAFSDDIDSETRTNHTWDIGADEAAEKIYRSVGPSASTALETGSGNDLTISGTTATFAEALASQVGVGDVIQYDDDNDGDIDADDSLAFIHGRTSSTVYTVKNSTGGTPTATAAADQDWSIFRAYDSLSHAESGDENDSIDDDLEAFESWSGGKDLTSSNEQWNIACYNGEGDAADTTAVTIDGWTTGENNYIKVYTPTETDEVGTSQRHEGVWDDTKYNLNYDGNWASIYINESYTIVDGLQVKMSYSNANLFGAGVYVNSGSDVTISNNIIESTISRTYSNSVGIRILDGGKAYNNIVYGGFYINIAIFASEDAIFTAYNNTLIDATNDGVTTSSSYTSSVYYYYKNNIIQNSGDNDYDIESGLSHLITSTNISSDDTSPDGAGYQNIDISFQDETNDDFHLASTDTSAKDAGTDLSSDSNLSFSDDVDGDTRPSPLWDIGADEYPAKRKIRFEGDFEMEGDFEIE